MQKGGGAPGGIDVTECNDGTVCPCSPHAHRLPLELKLPPADAYHKLRHTIEEVNALIATHYGDDERHRVGGWAGGVAGGQELELRVPHQKMRASGRNCLTHITTPCRRCRRCCSWTR